MAVFGSRDFNLPNVPLHNKLGNKITALTFKLLFGINISDAQTGLRGIPRKYLYEFANSVEGSRFEYESNILIYMSENDIAFDEIKIQTLYLDENKSSHFKPVQDAIRIYKPILSKSKPFKFFCSSIFSTLIDLILFTLFNSIFKNVNILILQTLITTGVARVISAIVNYSINKKIVFNSKEKTSKSAVKYFSLAIFQYCMSWLICTGAFSLISKTGILRTFIKLLIDFSIFIFSYFAQKKWVFSK